VEQHILNRQKRSSEEGFADYARVLRSLAATRDFRIGLEDYLHGLSNEVIALWLAMENLLFDRFMAKAYLYESAADYARGTTLGIGMVSVVQIVKLKGVTAQNLDKYTERNKAALGLEKVCFH
jgi:hypothetical protein